MSDMSQNKSIDLSQSEPGKQNPMNEQGGLGSTVVENKEDSNSQGEIEVSSAPDPTIDEDNGSQEDDCLKKKTTKSKKWVVVATVVFAVFVLSAGGIWGMELYDKFFKIVPIKQVLPGDVEAVLLVNLNPEASQYALLDKHMKKFPGYDHLMKEFDDVGEGKTLSQFIQDKLKQHGLDFQEDIKPVLGETGYILVPDLDPIEKEFQNKISWLGGGAKSFSKDYFALGGDVEKIAQGSRQNGTRVLGTTSDYFMTSEGGEEKVDPVDFVIGAEIEDLKEAKRVVEKMQANTESYEVSQLEHEGYEYFKITNKKNEGDGGLLCIKDTYHVLLGKNWIMATLEDDVKKMIDSRKGDHLTTQLMFFEKAQADEFKSLEDNDNFHGALKDLQIKDSATDAGLLSVFFEVDFGEFFDFETTPNMNGGMNYADFFKYPEPYVGGFFVKAEDEGIVFRSTSNQFTFDEADNLPISEGLVAKIPQQMDSRWADMFFEADNVKSMYYSFKRDNLTEKGLEQWNKTRGEFNQALGLDFEKDFVDQLTGSLAFVAYTSWGLEPEMVVMGGVESEEKVVDVVRKVIEVGKQMYLSMNPYAVCFQSPAQQQSASGSDVAEQCSQIPAEQKKVIGAQLEAINASTLVESESEAGKIYSYKIPGTELSFDLGFKDGQAIFGSHHAIVLAAMKELGANPDKSIAKSEGFGTVAENVFPKGYSKAFVNTLGFWNSVEYYVAKAGLTEGEEKEVLSAIGSIVKTVNLVGGVEAISQERKDALSSAYFGIKELSKEEKQKAEMILDAAW